MVVAKRTIKNQLTLPKAVVEQAGMADYYDVFCYNGLIVLTPCIPPVPDSESALRPGVRVLGASSASPPATSAPPKLRPFSETPANPKKTRLDASNYAL